MTTKEISIFIFAVGGDTGSRTILAGKIDELERR